MLKIDVSTFALLLSLVVPGLVARKSRRTLIAQTLEVTGPTTELGELVTLSLYVHLLIFAIAWALTLAAGAIRLHAAFGYFRIADGINYSAWCASHRIEELLGAALYMCLSLFVGCFVGLVSGWLQMSHPVGQLIDFSPRLSAILRKVGIFSVLEEKPLSYELFSGESVRRRRDLICFLELELRDGRGFITGEVEKYSVGKDEELHRPVVLLYAKRKTTIDDEYVDLQGHKLLIDLADALTVQIAYQERVPDVADTE